MARTLILAAATVIMVAAALLDPGLRFVYLLFAFLGLLGTIKTYRSCRPQSL